MHTQTQNSAPPPPPIGATLRIDSVYPPSYRSVFSKFEEFNAVQTQVFSAVGGGDSNVVVSAPTGSGKTAVFEMAIIRLLQRQQIEDPTIGRSTGFKKSHKIVYIAPNKALCDERLRDWQAR